MHADTASVWARAQDLLAVPRLPAFATRFGLRVIPGLTRNPGAESPRSQDRARFAGRTQRIFYKPIIQSMRKHYERRE